MSPANVTKTTISKYVQNVARQTIHGGNALLNIKKCINCQGPHSSLATRCPERKKIINNKRKAKENTESTQYADALRKTTPPTQLPNLPNMTTVLTPTTQVTIFQAMLHAHAVNIVIPGSYSETYNELMRNHNLPTLNITTDPPSQLIFNSLAQGHVEAAMASTQGVSTEKDESVKPKQKISNTASTSQKNTTTNNTTPAATPTQTARKGKTKASEIGLKLYSNKANGWPKQEDFSRQELIKGIKSKRYKFTFTESTISADELMKLIDN